MALVIYQMTHNRIFQNEYLHKTLISYKLYDKSPSVDGLWFDLYSHDQKIPSPLKNLHENTPDHVHKNLQKILF